MLAARREVHKVKVLRNRKEPAAGFPSRLVIGVHNDDTTDEEETDTEAKKHNARARSTPSAAKKQDGPAPAQILVQHGPEELQGSYTLYSSEHNGRPLWRKTREPQQWLLFSCEDEAWYISDELEDQGYDRIEADEVSFLPPLGVAFQEGCVLNEVTLLDMQVEPVRTGCSHSTATSDDGGASESDEGVSVDGDDEFADQSYLSDDEGVSGDEPDDNRATSAQLL
jgi:hypothetical protein